MERNRDQESNHPDFVFVPDVGPHEVGINPDDFAHREDGLIMTKAEYEKLSSSRLDITPEGGYSPYFRHL